jgi:hypothetical protein
MKVGRLRNRTKKEEPVPTLIAFVSGDSFTVAENFELITQILSNSEGGQFDRALDAGGWARTLVWRSAVAYVQEIAET